MQGYCQEQGAWAVSIFYATIASVEQDIKQGKEKQRAPLREGETRDKTGLVPVKRLVGTSLVDGAAAM